MEKLEDLNLLNLKIYQDDKLYCFTSDSILLAKFARAKVNDVVADFCSGSGIVGFYLYGLNPRIKSVSFFELQKPLFNLCVKSIEYNKKQDTFFAFNERVQNVPAKNNGKFSLIVCNPPYQKKNSGETDSDALKEKCKTEIEITNEELIKSVSGSLKFGGRIALCNRSDRLIEVIYEMKKNNIEPKRLQFVYSNPKEPYLFLIEGVKGGKSGLKVLPNIINNGSSI